MSFSSPTITLVASDGVSFTVTKSILSQSELLVNLIVFHEDGVPLSLPSIDGTTLGKVIEYCELHADDEPAPTQRVDEKRLDDISPTDVALVGGCNNAILFSLVLASNYLQIKPLLDLTCKIVASGIKGKTPEDIRKTFHIKNDFTPEEELQVMRENDWCEER